MVKTWNFYTFAKYLRGIMKLKFSIPYQTNWGESIIIDFTYVSADGYQRNIGMPMQTTDGYTWSYETSALTSRHHRFIGISYFYKVVDAEGKVLRREGPSAVRSYPYDETMSYHFPDFWLIDSMERKGVRPSLKGKRQQQEIVIPTLPLFQHTILFKVSAPRLSRGEALAILGNHPVLGAWNTERYLPMSAIGNYEWMLSINTFSIEKPLKYKYVVIDEQKHCFKRWENGEDRYVEEQHLTNEDVLILNGGEFRNKKADTAAVFNFDTYIFDLDGTLLDTIGDLADSCNHALRANDMPERSLEEIRLFVGNGVRKLMERAIPDGVDNPRFEDAYDDFRKYYLKHNMDTTQPYQDIMEVLVELKERGKHIAVVSNKFYDATQQLCAHFFGDLVDVAIGEREDIHKKPAPDTVEEALRQLGVEKEKAVYIGDSEVDIETAKNCGIPCISVLWGLRERDFLMDHGATIFVYTPSQLI